MRTITRPSNSGQAQTPPKEPGVYEGELIEVEEREFSSNYHESGKREALAMKYRLIDDSGNEFIVSDYPNLSLHPKSKLSGRLEGLEMMPDPGEELDLDQLEGLKVESVIDIDNNGDKEYNTIVRVSRLD